MSPCPRLTRRGLAALFGLSLALTVPAHPGHSLHDAQVTHLLTSPDHLWVIGVAAAFISLAVCWGKRVRRTRARG